MGMWFKPNQPTTPESPHLAMVPDWVNPSQVDFSIGTSLPGSVRGFLNVMPENTGVVNRNPAPFTADGRIYCYEQTGAWVFLVQLLDATTLGVGSLPQNIPTCAFARPFAFTATTTFDYKR